MVPTATQLPTLPFFTASNLLFSWGTGPRIACSGSGTPCSRTGIPSTTSGLRRERSRRASRAHRTFRIFPP